MRMRVSICPLTRHDDTWDRPDGLQITFQSHPWILWGDTGARQKTQSRGLWGGHQRLLLPFLPIVSSASTDFPLHLNCCSTQSHFACYQANGWSTLADNSCQRCSPLSSTQLIHLLLYMNQERKVKRPPVCHEWEKMETHGAKWNCSWSADMDAPRADGRLQREDDMFQCLQLQLNWTKSLQACRGQFLICPFGTKRNILIRRLYNGNAFLRFVGYW